VTNGGTTTYRQLNALLSNSLDQFVSMMHRKLRSGRIHLLVPTELPLARDLIIMIYVEVLKLNRPCTDCSCMGNVSSSSRLYS
jgi:hypothetical protein